MRRFFHIYTLASLCVCAASVSAQEKTPVALTSDNEELATSIGSLSQQENGSHHRL